MLRPQVSGRPMQLGVVMGLGPAPARLNLAESPHKGQVQLYPDPSPCPPHPPCPPSPSPSPSPDPAQHQSICIIVLILIVSIALCLLRPQVSDRLMQLGVAMGLGLAMALVASEELWPHAFTQEADIIAAVRELSPLALAMLPINAIVSDAARRSPAAALRRPCRPPTRALAALLAAAVQPAGRCYREPPCAPPPLNPQVYVLDGVFVGANDLRFLVKAMLAAAGFGTPLLLAVQPLNLGLVRGCAAGWCPDL